MPVRLTHPGFAVSADITAAVRLNRGLVELPEMESDFHREYHDRDLREAFLDVSGAWAGRAGAPEAVAAKGQVEDSWAEVGVATIDVVVSGRRRPVPVLRIGRFSAFQVREEGVLVTVLASNMELRFPGLVRLTDLELMLFAMENIDTELIAEALAEERREHIEQMRNQTPHSS
jgi:hypothetical protein